MSYTQIFAIAPNGDAEKIGETRNAHLGAMAVWDVLAEKYIGKETQPEHMRRYSVLSSMMATNKMGPLWALHKDPRLTAAERITLYSTFDNVLVESVHLTRLTDAFREVAASIPHSSLTEQADILDAHMVANPLTLGFGWNQTSVNGDVFQAWDESGDNVQYNINSHNADKHWWLFESLDSRSQ